MPDVTGYRAKVGVIIPSTNTVVEAGRHLGYDVELRGTTAIRVTACDPKTGKVTMRTAKAPPQAIPGGIPSTGLLADVVVRKYLDHTPINRLQQIYERHGVHIARNTLYTHYRGRSAEPPDFAVSSIAELAPSASSVLAAAGRQRTLLEALRSIPLQFQVVLELSFWERLTAAEIGEVVGAPEGTVRTRLRRASE